MLIAVAILHVGRKVRAVKDREAIHNSISSSVISHRDRYNRDTHLSSRVPHVYLPDPLSELIIKYIHLLVSNGDCMIIQNLLTF